MSSGLIYGCMGLGRWDGEALDAADRARAEAAVEAALAAGITRFDHADIYGHGTAEAVFGAVLAQAPGLRDRIQIQSKCGIRLGTADSPQMYDLRAHTVRARVHESLERLGTGHLDLLLLHRPDPLTPPEEIGAVLTALHDEGVVHAVGVSNMSAVQITALQRHTGPRLVANQLEMGLHRRAWLEGAVLVNTPASAEVGFPHGTVEHCRAEGIELQAWGALANGRFTGLPQDPGDEAVADLLRRLAEDQGTTPETVLLWWLQQHPAGVVPVIGTTSPERIASCSGAVDGSARLSHEEWYGLWVTARGGQLP
ncbi:aldo/keto reductase [Nocardioides jiangxiensis]|uniref:Aldo/keto reductase n=1 Tax=Nocardioides jiangxiensis TaxID=3064524 RepID=A0ABT9B2C7_9ACTN|nr:aldo/keto reductase [Nocardioides sp. WY-20]MDO7868363.1 aldo/keto reductase [Nocardioides sp. WY-20]